MSNPVPFPSYEIARCPYPFYDVAREEPIYQVPDTGNFIVTKFEDVAQVLSNNELFSSASVLMQDGEHRACTVDEARHATVGPFVAMDPPVHSPRRMVARQILKPDDIKSLEPLVARTIDELIETFEHKGACEFISSFALRLPTRVVLNMLGLPLEDEDRAITWSQYDGRGTRFHPKDRRDGIKGTLLDVADYMRVAVQERYDHPRDDGLGRFVSAHVASEGSFNLTNAIADASLLLFGGITTTAHMLGNVMKLILDDEALHQRVLADPSCLPAVINESLRLESPVQWVDRICLEDTEVGGVLIPAGAILLVLIGAANRDEHVFSEANDVDLSRRGPGHVAFGYGIHTCIGAPLARTEGKMAFETLFQRLPRLRYADGNDFEPVGGTMLFRGVEKLNLRFD